MKRFFVCDLTDTAFSESRRYSGRNRDIIPNLREPFETEGADPMIVKYLRLAIVLLTGLQLAGCYTDYGPVEVETRPVSLSGAGRGCAFATGRKD